MSKPADIPQDVWQVAQNICDQACMPEHYYTNGVVSATQEDIARAIIAATEAEREACALIAAEYHDHPSELAAFVGEEIADDIRARAFEVNTAHKNSVEA